MPYAELANLIETHKLEIGLLIAREAKARQLPTYKDEPDLDLSRKFQPTIEMVGRYLLSGDASEYRGYVRELALQRFNQGYNADEFYLMAELLTIAINQIVAREFSNPDQASDRERFRLRLGGIQTLAHASIVGARIMFNQKSI